MGNFCCIQDRRKYSPSLQSEKQIIKKQETSKSIKPKQQTQPLTKNTKLNEQNTAKNSIQSFEIPKVVSLISVKSQIQKRQIEILSSQNMSLQHYKNFQRAKMTDRNNRLLVKDVYNALCSLIFSLLIKSPEKLRKIQGKIIFFTSFPTLRSSTAKTTQEYGDVNSTDDILKLFLGYLLSLFQKSGIQLLQSYSIIQSVLERVVLAYVTYVYPQMKQQLEDNYNKNNFPMDFIDKVLRAFQIKYQWKEGNRLLSMSQNQKCCNIYFDRQNCCTVDGL